jgi:uncharacterized protein (DUF302 family)
MNGLITLESAFDATETVARLHSAITTSGNSIFALFDHAAAAVATGLSLRPTTVIAFGNPAAGTKLMQMHQMVGIDLPLKILVWQDEANKVRIGYNDPQRLSDRHGLGPEAQPVITAMARLLATVTEQSVRAAA